jgi:collagenase-like PrtC family protease
MQPKTINSSGIKKPELLSPAGDRDSLQAAVQNGADAVYLGVKDFNARLNTRNFTTKELGGVVSMAHSNGVRVYLTLNTLVKNSEIRAFFNVLSEAYLTGIDGVIIQHISFLDIIKRNFPGLRVFISTQGAIGNVASALVVKSADRIILPRELQLDEIKKFVKAGVSTEVFVHGALCFSYSGLCLFSSFVSSRSGNRGSCAQLCRQKYNGEYPLSTREVCLVRRIPELIEAGIQGFKIEGRMRSPLYVAVATRMYRKAIDSYLKGNFVLPQKEMQEIEVVFNREFTEGLMFGESQITSPLKPMNRGAFLGEVRDGRIIVSRTVAAGDGIGIWDNGEVTGNTIKEMSRDGMKVQSASAGEKVTLGLKINDGARVYLTSSPGISIQTGLRFERVPVKSSERKKVEVVLPGIKPRTPAGTRLLVKAYSMPEAVESAQAGADIVFLDIFHREFPDAGNWHEKALLGAYLPRIMNDSELASALDLLKIKSPAAILIGNMGALPACAGIDVPKFVDYSLNTFNDLDIQFVKGFNAVPLMSPELSLSELSQLKNKDMVIFCHGDIALVNSMIDPGAEELLDEKGSRFRVRKEDKYWQILNSHPFGLFDAVQNIRKLGFSSFYIDREDRGADSVRIYLALLNAGTVNRRARKGFTSGHLFKPVN